jgi:hypothetical protein
MQFGETLIEAARLAACGATGGLIYWAAREHGQIFKLAWKRIARR